MERRVGQCWWTGLLRGTSCGRYFHQAYESKSLRDVKWEVAYASFRPPI